MADYSLVKTRMTEGLWEGIVRTTERAAPPPEILVTHLEASVPGVTVTPVEAQDGWLLQIPIPLSAIGDGVQTFLIHDARNDVLLDSFTIIAGDAMAEDIRAEMDLLRAELDMLKRAFRRHCIETT